MLKWLSDQQDFEEKKNERYGVDQNCIEHQSIATRFSKLQNRLIRFSLLDRLVANRTLQRHHEEEDAQTS